MVNVGISYLRADLYLVLYGLVILMAFLVNPFLFFYYEEKQEEELEGQSRIASVGCENGFSFSAFELAVRLANTLRCSMDSGLSDLSGHSDLTRVCRAYRFLSHYVRLRISASSFRNWRRYQQIIPPANGIVSST